MKIPRPLHSWDVTPTRAVVIQRELATQVDPSGDFEHPRLVAGADLAFSSDGKECIAGVVVWNVNERTAIEKRVARAPVTFPYVPGLLSFREAPAIIATLKTIENEPDVLMFDGQGLAHPRRFGLACHVGLLLDKPSIGCAKSVLTGKYDEPGTTAGSTTPLSDLGERIGTVLRTRDNVKPIYVSVGHRLGLEAAERITMLCCGGYRLPEPTRLADKLVAEAKSSG